MPIKGSLCRRDKHSNAAVSKKRAKIDMGFDYVDGIDIVWLAPRRGLPAGNACPGATRLARPCQVRPVGDRLPVPVIAPASFPRASEPPSFPHPPCRHNPPRLHAPSACQVRAVGAVAAPAALRCLLLCMVEGVASEPGRIACCRLSDELVAAAALVVIWRIPPEQRQQRRR